MAVIFLLHSYRLWDCFLFSHWHLASELKDKQAGRNVLQTELAKISLQCWCPSLQWILCQIMNFIHWGKGLSPSFKSCNDNPICKTEKETQMYRTDFWTLWEKAKVGCFKRTASKHVYYLGWNRSPAQVGCMRQALGPGALGKPSGIGWSGWWEGGSGWGIHVNPWLIHVNV